MRNETGDIYTTYVGIVFGYCDFQNCEQRLPNTISGNSIHPLLQFESSEAKEHFSISIDKDVPPVRTCVIRGKGVFFK